MHEEFSSSYLDRFNSCHFRVYSTSGEESIPWTFRLHHPKNTDHDFAADSRKKMKVLTTFITTVASLLHWGLRPYRSKGWESEISESLGFLSPLHPFSQLLCLCLCFVPNPLSLTTERSTVFPSDRLVFRDQILRRNIHARLNLYRRRVAINIITLFEMSAWLTFWFSKSLPLLWKSIAYRSERETPSWPDGDDVNLYRDNFLGMDHQNKNRSKGTPHKRVSDVNKSAFFLSVISVDKSLWWGLMKSLLFGLTQH